MRIEEILELLDDKKRFMIQTDDYKTIGIFSKADVGLHTYLQVTKPHHIKKIDAFYLFPQTEMFVITISFKEE